METDNLLRAQRATKSLLLQTPVPGARMADEDALFAEFMGEIKNTVVAAETQASVEGDDAGAASDAASVGDVGADDGDGAEEKGIDATKRKSEDAEVRRLLLSARCSPCSHVHSYLRVLRTTKGVSSAAKQVHYLHRRGPSLYCNRKVIRWRLTGVTLNRKRVMVYRRQRTFL